MTFQTSRPERPALYTRVSTEEQAERESIRTQLDFGEKFADLHRFTWIRIYRDEGVSGVIPLEQRPAGRRLLEEARAGLFNGLYLPRLDRLARDPRITLNAVHTLEEIGCRVVSMTEPFDTGEPVGKLMMTMLAGFAGFERDLIRERTQAGLRRHALTGRWMGGRVPYGYIVTGEGEAARLAPDDEPPEGHLTSPADAVVMIYHLIDGGASCLGVADRFKLLDIPPYFRKGAWTHGRGGRPITGEWRSNTVWQVATNTVYKGIHRYGKRGGQVIERPCHALVEEELWERVRVRLQQNRSWRNRADHRRYLLRGFVRCARCGSVYVGQGKHGNHFYYTCSGNTRVYAEQEICRAPRLNAGWTEDALWEEALIALQDPDRVLARAAAARPTHPFDTTGEIARLELRLGTLATERERMVRLYRRGAIDDQGYDSQIREIEEEEESIRLRLSELRAPLRSPDADGREGQRLLSEARSYLAGDGEPDWEKKRAVLLCLIRQIRVAGQPGRYNKRELTIFWRFTPEGTFFTLHL